MTNTFRIVVLGFCLLLSVHAGADQLSDATALFARYTSLEAAFDPGIADLYADDALIKNKRIYPTGQTREVVLPASQYKQLLRSVMPLTKARGDYSTYSEVKFQTEGNAVRIFAKRFSVLKKYYSPISLLVAPTPSGAWVIREELSESRP
jgi:hypothetical protein